MNKSSKKIVDLFNILIQDFYSIEILKELLKIKPATILQYISLFKKVGFEIKRKNGKYKIVYFSNNFSLSSLQESLLAHILCISNQYLSKRKIKEAKEIVDEILYKTTQKEKKNVEEKYELFKEIKLKIKEEKKIEIFQKALDKSLNLKVILKNSLKEYSLKPLNFRYGKEDIFLVFRNFKNNSLKEIKIDKIEKLYPTRNIPTISKEEEVIFELYSNLAKKYILKEGEKILERYENKIIVSTPAFEKEKLTARLLRYDFLCKVLYPKTFQENFKKILKKSLDNLKELNHN